MNWSLNNIFYNILWPRSTSLHRAFRAQSQKMSYIWAFDFFKLWENVLFDRWYLEDRNVNLAHAGINAYETKMSRRFKIIKKSYLKGTFGLDVYFFFPSAKNFHFLRLWCIRIYNGRLGKKNLSFIYSTAFPIVSKFSFFLFCQSGKVMISLSLLDNARNL